MASTTVDILCYGDSNTWGEFPLQTFYIRTNARWANLLEASLSLDTNVQFNVIQNGLSGRYAGDIDQIRPHLNGLVDFKSKYTPLDSTSLVIIALGSNDLKLTYSQSPQNIFDNLVSYREILAQNNFQGKVVYLLPPFVNENKLGEVFESSNARLTALYNLFEESDLEFLNLNNIIEMEDLPDGIHYRYEAHAKIADLVGKYILASYP